MFSDLTAALDQHIAAYAATLESAPTERSLLRRLPIHGRPPHMRLADALPTPITSHETPSGTLWVKRDDMTSTLYGGNKVRKLEYVLPQAQLKGCTPLVVGATASHQVLATAMYTRLLGMRCEVVLFPQPPLPGEQIVAAVLAAFDIPIGRAKTANYSPVTTAQMLVASRRRAGKTCLIYPGSSSPAGNLGYVDCGLEIADSVSAGDCPEPDAVFTAFGTGGTAVGLVLGLALGGLDSRVHAVRVADATVSNHAHLRLLEWRTRRRLTRLGVDTTAALDRLVLDTRYLGDGYGHVLPRAAEATEFAHANGMPIDPTYTAKALAAALDYQRCHPTEVVMFVETLSAVSPIPET